MAAAQPPTSLPQTSSAGAYRWLALLVVGIGTFMSTLDISIVTISFPTLTRVFNVSPSMVLWVSLGYLLVMTGLMMTWGRLGDTLGRKRVYTVGFVGFTLGVALCALAQNVLQLILFRVLQAIGAAMTVAVGTAIITDAFGLQRGRALGILGATVGAGLMSGPAIGGVILDALDWRAIFYVRIPVGVVGTLLAALVLRDDRPMAGTRHFDVWGSFSLFLGLACLLIGVNQGQSLGWGSPLVMGLFLGWLVFLTLFVLIEVRVPHPVVDLSLFRNRLFSTSNASLVLSFMSRGGIPFLMPFYFIQGQGYSSTTAGLALTTVPLTMGVLAPLAGWLSDHWGPRGISSLGLTIVLVGLWLLTGVETQTPLWNVVGRLFVMGVGSAFFESPNNSAIMGSAPRERLGTASAMIATSRSVGISIGLAISGAIFAGRQPLYLTQMMDQGLPAQMAFSSALVHSMTDALTVSVVLCGLSLAVSLVPEAARLQGRPKRK